MWHFRSRGIWSWSDALSFLTVVHLLHVGHTPSIHAMDAGAGCHDRHAPRRSGQSLVQ